MSQCLGTLACTISTSFAKALLILIVGISIWHIASWLIQNQQGYSPSLFKGLDVKGVSLWIRSSSASPFQGAPLMVRKIHIMLACLALTLCGCCATVDRSRESPKQAIERA
jgi:hypothetical protein